MLELSLLAGKTMETTDYCNRVLPAEILEKLEAGAYRQLCEHLRQRSEEVQNMDLMTISGFCRNCLAKWLVVEARRLSDEMKNRQLKNTNGSDFEATESDVKALDAMGYDEAAEHVYGMGYGDWKKRYMKKATDEKLEKYNASKSIHAKHDKDLLATRADKPEHKSLQEHAAKSSSPSVKLANVCCEDPEFVTDMAAVSVPPTGSTGKRVRVATPQMPSPPTGTIKLSVGILTVSDRASTGEYQTGDLSGPAVATSVETILKTIANKEETEVEYRLVKSAIVPDDIQAIQSKLKDWTSGEAALDLLLTTGGTGFAPRDVTPEATTSILDKECHGLMSFISSECSKLQPLAALSRGTAGVRGRTLIANLPGNPKGVEEVVPVLLPLALHAIVDLQKESNT